MANKWRMVESELYKGYPAGFAVGHAKHWKDGVSLYKTPEMMGEARPTFAVTDEFIEFAGRRMSVDQWNKLADMVEAA